MIAFLLPLAWALGGGIAVLTVRKIAWAAHGALLARAVWKQTHQRTPSPTSDREGVGLRPGDHLIVVRGGYSHHGVYVGNRRVVHFTGEPLAKKGAHIEEEDLRVFFGGCTSVGVVEHADALPSDEILARARSCLGSGEGTYDLLINNCEHFATWCVTGHAHSSQVEPAKEFVVAAGKHLTVELLLRVLMV